MFLRMMCIQKEDFLVFLSLLLLVTLIVFAEYQGGIFFLIKTRTIAL